MTRFTDFNRQISSRSIIHVCVLFVFFAAFSAYTLPVALRGELNAPPEMGVAAPWDGSRWLGSDAPDFAAIGLQLSKGNGYSINYDDPDYRAPYLQNNQDGRYDWMLNRHGEGVTAYRSPLLPGLIAITYKLFGRKFWPIRVLNGFLIALSCVFAFSMISSRFGIIPGLLCAGWLITDVRLQVYSRMIMTEAPAVFVTTLICWLLLWTVETRSWKASVTLGIITGVAFLTRSVFVLWMPIIVTGVYFLSLRPNITWHGISAFSLPAFVLASFLAVSAPWMFRNCIVLGGIEPLGTMGPISTTISLVAGYSDTALQRRGVWFTLEELSPSEAGYFAEFQTDEFKKKPGLEQEIALTSKNRQRALKWIAENPAKVPLLMYFKVRSLWSPLAPADAMLLFFSALGGLNFLLARPREALALLVLLAACSMAVAVTWDMGNGRFLVPVHPILAMLSALGLWAVIISATEVVTERIKLNKIGQ
jgi:4-amino-4-deoxy-L-arabinose transferase-like glycosyltransferase